MRQVTPIPGVPGLFRLAHGELNGYLIVRAGRFILIDCPVRRLPIPGPDAVLHTHIQREHCGEWAACPEVPVYVPAGATDLATLSRAFKAECHTTWAEDRDWGYRGEEKYGFGRCLIVRPPARRLNVVGELTPGATFTWQDVTLEVLALPGSGKFAVGLYWRQHGLLFSGDLLRAGGYLVNLYDLERSYGILTGYQQLRDSLAAAKSRRPRLLLPATGPASTRPLADIRRLESRVDAFRRLKAPRTDEPRAIINYLPRREFSRYREVMPGLYQNTNAGNIILFVDAQGRGLMVDPDNCVWKTWQQNCREFHADLDRLERHTGLRRVELALITHYHGDHLEYSNLLRRRYGTKILATPDVAAVVERPEDFPYPCRIDWYGFPFKRLKIDRAIPYNRPLDWHGTPVVPVWTPGHCNVHAGFLVRWQGQRVFCAGDVIQYGQGPIGCPLPVIYSDTAWPERGLMGMLDRLTKLRPQLIMGGHSHSCFDPDGTILRDMRQTAWAACRCVRQWVHDGDLRRAMTPPGYVAQRPPRTLPRRRSG